MVICVCVCVCVLMPVLRSYKNQSILSQDVVFQRSTVCTKKNLLSPTIVAPLVNNCLISQFQENVTSFNFQANAHCVKCPNTEFFSGPYFSTFGLKREIYGVNLRIQIECGKIRTRKKSVFGHFSRSGTEFTKLRD